MATFSSSFEPGRTVLYVPTHAHGNLGHPDVERGVVTSTNDVFVFVRFGAKTHAQACRPADLVYEHGSAVNGEGAAR